MERIKEEFLDKVESIIPLAAKSVLEIGCGTGTRSAAIAKRCHFLEAIEPSLEALIIAKTKNQAGNIRYQQGDAQNLPFEDYTFDVAVFTLSLHHVPMGEMSKAITEAVRVTKRGGYIVFLEPGNKGTYFDAEIGFDAGDGDERKEKARAYFEILHHTGYTEVAELEDETVFKFSSVEDFVSTVEPKKDIDRLESFLKQNDFILNAERRINIFKV